MRSKHRAALRDLRVFRLNAIVAVGAIVFAAVAGASFSHSANSPVAGETKPTTASNICPTTVAVQAIDRKSARRAVSKSPAYTQGLIFTDGNLYEGTGKKGRSAIYRLDLHEGTRTELFALDRSLFGEGIARIGNRFYQLTWRAGLAFAYEYDGGQQFVRTTTFNRDGEGWGLTDFADELVLSDGTDKLSFLDAKSFAVIRQVPVRLGNRPLPYLNELEAVGDVILANVYGDSSIVAIDPTNGCVTAILDASRLVASMEKELNALPNPVCPGRCSRMDFILNGIAYDENADDLYITGKNWPLIFIYRGLFG